MNNKPIKALTLCGLLAILTLQGIWLFTTYSTVKNETIKKSNELFKNAITTELQTRMDDCTDNDGNDVLIERKFHLDLEGDNIEDSESMTSQVHLFLQETLDTLFHSPVSLNKLDSIYQVQLEQANIHTQTTCNLVDSAGIVLNSSVPDYQIPPGSNITNRYNDYQVKQQVRAASCLNQSLLGYFPSDGVIACCDRPDHDLCRLLYYLSDKNHQQTKQNSPGKRRFLIRHDSRHENAPQLDYHVYEFPT